LAVGGAGRVRAVAPVDVVLPGVIEAARVAEVEAERGLVSCDAGSVPLPLLTVTEFTVGGTLLTLTIVVYSLLPPSLSMTLPLTV
jgi:hypothetical protein